MAAVAGASILNAPADAVAQGGNSSKWVVAALSGQVAQSADGTNWRRVSNGERLAFGTRLKTGPEGSARIERGEDVISLSPASVVELPKGANGGGADGVNQTLGTLLYKIFTRPNRRFAIDTPYLAAVIKGTTFTIVVGPDSAALHVTEGAVEVSSRLSADVALIRPGQTAIVSRTGDRGMRILGGNPEKRGDPAPAGPPRDPARQQANAEPARDGVAPAAESALETVRIVTAIGPKGIDVREATNGLVGGARPGSASDDALDETEEKTDSIVAALADFPAGDDGGVSSILATGESTGLITDLAGGLLGDTGLLGDSGPLLGDSGALGGSGGDSGLLGDSELLDGSGLLGEED